MFVDGWMAFVHAYINDIILHSNPLIQHLTFRHMSLHHEYMQYLTLLYLTLALTLALLDLTWPLHFITLPYRTLTFFFFFKKLTLPHLTYRPCANPCLGVSVLPKATAEIRLKLAPEAERRAGWRWRTSFFFVLWSMLGAGRKNIAKALFVVYIIRKHIL